MSTYTLGNKFVSSDGNGATMISGDVKETTSPGQYTASTPLSSTTYTIGNIYQCSTSRNIDVKGNSQENCAGRGVTCEYNLKVVGSPELFEATAQLAADKDTAGLVSLLLQSGDDRNFTLPSPLDAINPMEVVSNMSSGLQTSLSPNLPPIRDLTDIPMSLAKMTAWSGTVTLANAQEQAQHAAAFTIEQQRRRVQMNIEAGTRLLGDSFDPSTANAGAPSSDLRQGNYSLTNEMVFSEFVSCVDSLYANQKRIG